MKKENLLVIALALLMPVMLNAQSKEDQPYVTKTFTNSSLHSLSVETSGGSITVAGSRAGAGFKVEMYVKPNNWNGKSELSKEEIEDRLEDYDILIGTEGNKVVATAKRKGNIERNKGISIAFKVFTPRQISTDLKTSGGSIKISSLSGTQTFTTSGGSLKVADLDGIVSGKTSGGSIEAIRCSNDIKLVTSGGSIKAEEMKGKVTLHTSGGSIAIRNLAGEINAHTSGGSVQGGDIQGELVAGTSGGSVKLTNISGSLKASTSAGSIEVAMASLGQYLSLSTSAGNVHVTMPIDKGVDLNIRGNKVTIPLKNFDGNAEKNRVTGKMNGGGVPVTLSASSGSVYVNSSR